MMRRSIVAHYNWSRYRMPTQMPKFDGPAPVAAPQNMNSTKTNEFIDPIDDKFPISIRGPLVRPDVPEDQYVDSWYVCTSMTHHLGDYRPWSASAPANAYRFRPHNEFDAKGREYVQYMREFSRVDLSKQHEARGEGQKGFPFRDAYLTKMNEENSTTPPPSLETVMDRAVVEQHHKSPVTSPLEVQRDVGRLEAPLACAGKIPVDRSQFPFRWKTEDWYEYEVAKVRNKRFVLENTEKKGIQGSEVTYKIILEGYWDHHVMKLADDVSMFLRDIGRQIVEEKLAAVRRMLTGLEGGASIDAELLDAFNAAKKGPFGGPDEYDKEEVAHFMRADLKRLEEQCIGVINRCNVPVPGAMNTSDPHVSWPHVEKLEPWVRMAEFWTSSSDTSFTELEMSTAHYEFRKFFRVVVCKLPFQSTEFEKRMYDIRHWLHRQMSCEFHTIYRKNVVHDVSVFPTEHDPAQPTTHAHHRLFSFALDWQTAPVNRLSVETVLDGDTWDTLAARLGCSADELKDANPEVETALTAGAVVNVPPTAGRRRTSFGAATEGGRVFSLMQRSEKDGDQENEGKGEEEGKAGARRRVHNWEEAAAALDCTVEELQQINGEAVATYKHAEKSDERGMFDPSVTELRVPLSCWTSTPETEFSAVEPVFTGDTFASIARRLQCSEEALREINKAESEDPANGARHVRVPSDAKAPRRLVEPQLRPQAATDAIVARTAAEEKTFAVDHIPNAPPNAHMFPHEYHTPTSRFPVTPKEIGCEDDWMSYTATFLDKQFTYRSEPTPAYNVNKLWPMQQVPGKVDQTPFEEDQTWLMHPIPVQQMEQHHPEKDLQDLPFVNHEQFPRSLQWTAP